MNKIKVGTITKTRGLKGELKIESCTSFSAFRFAPGVFLYVGEKERRLQVATWRIIDGVDYLSFVNYQDIDLIADLIGCPLYAEEEVNLADDEFYYHELKQYLVDNYPVINVEELPRGVALRIKIGDKTRLIPLQKQFFTNIDRKEKKIILSDLGRMLLD